MAEAKVVKFCVLAGYVKCQPSDDRLSLKGAWLGSRDPFQNFTPLKFLWNGWR